MKISNNQLIVGGILLFLFLQSRNKTTQKAPVKPTQTPQRYSQADAERNAADSRVAGDWEIQCYHQVV